MRFSQFLYGYFLFSIDFWDEFVAGNFYLDLLQVQNVLFVWFESFEDGIGCDSSAGIRLQHLCDEVGELL